MGVDVVLMKVRQPGTSPRRRSVTRVDAVLDPAGVFVGICRDSELPMLRRADPYGTLVLTSAEMPQLVAELDTTRQRLHGAGWEIVTAVLALAERCLADRTTELHLDGD
jgi:hypothetical protein